MRIYLWLIPPQTAMPDDASAQTPHSTFGTWWVPWALFILLVAYPLSLGPVAVLHDKNMVPDGVGVIYKPLEYLYHHSPPVKRALDWYVEDLWGSDL